MPEERPPVQRGVWGDSGPGMQAVSLEGPGAVGRAGVDPVHLPQALSIPCLGGAVCEGHTK